MDATNLTASISALLRPRSIAFVGVSPRGGTGAKMLQSTLDSGFDGAIWIVNGNYPEIMGIACHASLAALPAVPDCVVVAIAAAPALTVVEEAARLGVKGALIVSEGFSDAGTSDGHELQARLVALATQYGMAVAGPNCMGVSSLANRFAVTMADVPASLPVGGISLVSQSGGLVNAVAQFAGARGIGLNYLASIGNQAVLGFADYIRFLADDAGTSVIACIMEGTSDGRAFRKAIEYATRRKPVVVLKLGRSETGQAATVAHTGTLAGRHEVFSAMFRQSGVALVGSIDELIETAALLELAPLPAGTKVAMLTVSGGATSMIADLADEAGVEFAPIGEATNARLQQILDVGRRFGNPIDTVGLPRLLREGNLEAILDTLVADDAIDLIGLVLGMRQEGAAVHEVLVEKMAKAARTAGKPLVILSFMSNGLAGYWRGYAQTHRIPIVEDLEQGLRTVRHLVDYASFRRRAAGSEGKPEPKAARRLAAFDTARDGRTLSEAESKIILGAAGLPVTREELATTDEAAARIAAEIGRPVAIKIQSADIPHKSDIGGVRLRVTGEDAVLQAAREVTANARAAHPDAAIEGVLVQEMVEGGVEFFLGMNYDEQYGPLIVLGAGGVTVEVFKDAAFGLAPLTRWDAERMLRDLKAQVMLDGFRGTPRLDRQALIQCCLDFSDFVVATEGSFAAIDLNPVFVLAEGNGVRIADALIVKAHPAEENAKWQREEMSLIA